MSETISSVKDRSMTFDYLVFSVRELFDVDRVRRKLKADNPSLKYISMLDYGEIYLLLFKKLR